MAKLEWVTARLPDPEYLPTPSFGINRALGGRGLASGRIHVYWGPKASGKTTLALQQIAVAQREGKVCAFIDSEKALDKYWAEKNGVDIDALLYTDTLVVEEALKLALPDIQNGNIDVLVVDSVGSLNYESFFDAPESQGMSTYARSSKMFTHKVLQALNPHQQVIFISQASMHKSGQHFVSAAQVGSAIEHWASTMIKVRKTGSTKPAEGKKSDDWREDGSFRVTWRLEKSKQSTYPVSGSYFFNPVTAEIDNVDEVIEAAKDAGILTGTTWLKYREGEEDELKWQGRTKLGEYLNENPEFYDSLVAELNTIELEEEAEGE